MATEDQVQVEPRQDPYWKEPVFRMALWIGGALVLLGLASVSVLPVTQTIAVLVLCSGLGIVFGGFGSTAVIRYKGIVIAGVAGIAIVLLMLVSYLTRDNILRVRIGGDVRGSTLDMFGDAAYPGADHKQFYEFVVIGRELSVANLQLTVTLPSTPDHPSERREILFECIPARVIGPLLGSGKTLQWRFDARRETLKGDQLEEVSSGPCDRANAATTPSFASIGFSLIPAAHAQGNRVASAAPYIRDLYSDSATVRRDARQVLAKAGIDAIPEIMAEWQRNPTNYRVRVGASVALAEFLRANKGQRTLVSSKLTEPHLELLTQAAGDPDRTIRIYASEFLFDLGDKRTIPIVQRVFPATTDDGKYNLILVLKGTRPYLSNDEKRALDQDLLTWRPSVGQNTRAQIDGLRAQL